MNLDLAIERGLERGNNRDSTVRVDQASQSALHNANDTDHLDAFGPTSEAYGELLTAYVYFNETLFNKCLPPCLITLNRKGRRTLGYFCHKRFVRLRDGSTATDEIAINPTHLVRYPVDFILSVLVHEMVHLWQAHFGKPGRGRYHNRAWAKKMEQVGLYPSNTGRPGGKRTGQAMSHYIMHGGPFSRATEALLQRGFRITWGDLPLQSNLDDSSGDGTEGPALVGNRVKYVCLGPVCRAAAWGKPNLHLRCDDCNRPMLSAHAAAPDASADPPARA